jgi:hypothetical protein
MNTDFTVLSHLGGLRGVALIAEERKRQIETLGYNPRQDDGYEHDELVRAAVAYASYQRPGITLPDSLWPWHLDWWKPRDQKANLVRAGALIAAELDRLLRAEAATDTGQQTLFGNAEVASGSGA